MEDTMPAPGFNNSYEKSKFDSEKLVRESGFPYTIYRPSIIVGRRSDGVIRKPLAFYRILEFFAMIKRNYCAKAKIAPNSPFKKDLRLQAGVTDKIYFVPIDYVQEAIVNLFPFPTENKTYHITGESPVSTKWIEEAVCEVLKAEGLQICDEVNDPTKEEKLVQRMISDLMPYFASEIIFDSSNVREKLGDDFLNWKLDINFLNPSTSCCCSARCTTSMTLPIGSSALRKRAGSASRAGCCFSRLFLTIWCFSPSWDMTRIISKPGILTPRPSGSTISPSSSTR